MAPESAGASYPNVIVAQVLVGTPVMGKRLLAGSGEGWGERLKHPYANLAVNVVRPV